jgi:AhpD family alkylhydroperoxidase
LTFDAFAGLADTFAFEEPAKPEAGQFGLLVREPVGVVGAIIPWNAPMALISNKVAPALLAGCTVILKSSPEAPGEGTIAVSKECDGCIAAHAHAAVQHGGTPEEAAEAIGVTFLLNGGPGTVYGARAYAAFQEFYSQRAGQLNGRQPVG